MRSKLCQKIVAGILLLTMSLAVVACNKPGPDQGSIGGGGGGGYGDLDDFFNDFFDDWNGSGSDKTHEQIDWTETYGEPGNKADYVDATGSQMFDPALGTHFYEAEYAEFEYPARVLFGSGSSGGLQVEYIEQGVVLSLDVYAAGDCTALLGMSLGCAAGNKLTTDLFAISYTDESGENAGIVEVDDYYFSASGWLAFKEQSIGEVPLKEGKNTIAVVSFGGFNLDYFTLTPQKSDVKEQPKDSFTPTPKGEWESVFGTYKLKEYLRADAVAEGFDPTWGAYKYEAEHARIFGGAAAKTTNANASGRATVGSSSESFIDIAIYSVADCEVLLKMAATTAATYKNTSLTSLMKVGLIGGDRATNADNLLSTGGLNNQPKENDLGTVRLKKGRNILRIEPMSHDTFEIDYIAVLPVKAGVVGNPDYDPNSGYVVPFDDWGTVYGKYDKGSYVSGKTNAFDPANGAHIYEAEDATLSEDLYIEGENGTGEGAGRKKPNASGYAQVGGFDGKGAHSTVTFEIESTCEYTALISLGYTSDSRFAQYLTADNFIKITYGDNNVVKCNDSRITAGNWTGDGVYVESYIGEITLAEGTNTVVFDFFNLISPNQICLDYILLSPKQADAAGYTVSYDLSGGEGDPIDSVKRKADSTFTVASGAGIQKIGYVFGGWTDGQTTYQGGETYTMPAHDVTFTAVWIKADMHSVSFLLDGGNGSQKVETHYAGEVFSLPDGTGLTKSGFVFGGWTDGKKCYGAGISMVMPDDDISLTAIWIPERNTWDSVYGLADPAKGYQKATKSNGVYEYDVERGTHIFEAEDLDRGSGLYVESNKVNASENKQLAGFSGDTRTFTLTVNASRRGAVLLTLGYTGNPGMNTSRPASYYFSVFNGTHMLDCSGTAVIAGDWGNDIYVELRLGVIYLNEGVNTIEFSFANLPFNDCIALDYVLLTGATTLYEEKVTLTYDLAGGNGNIPAVSRYAGEKFYLADGTGIEKEGFYFAGWTDGKTTYQGGELFTMPSEDIKLTAVWEVSGMHTVTFDTDGAEGSINSESHTANDAFTLPDGEGLAKTGYIFRGWVSENVYYAPGETVYMPNGDITFKAVWIADMDMWNSVYGEEGDHNSYTKESAESGVFEFDPSKGAHLYEGEDATLGACGGTGWSVESDKVNASGGKQLAGLGDYVSQLSYTINAKKSGAVMLVLGYTGHIDFGKDAVGGSPQEGGLLASRYIKVVNGKFELDSTGVELTVANWSAPNGGLYVECRIGIVYLHEGLNVLEFTFDHFAWPSCIALDYIALIPEATSAEHSSEPSTAAAVLEAYTRMMREAIPYRFES